MKLVYFAWVRERIGLTDEDITPPAHVTTAGELVDWLKTRGPQYEHALAEPSVIRVALDHVHAGREAPLRGVHEVALFPPMTGG